MLTMMPRFQPITLFAALHLFLVAPGQAQNHPFPQHPRYATGTIRPSQFAQEQLDRDVRAYYDTWKKDYVKAAGHDPDTGKPLFRVVMGKELPESGQTVSEGQGYGMVIIALMAGHDPESRTLFDGLYRFAQRHPGKASPHLMQWKIPLDPWMSNGTAFDGDADIAHGLMLAHAQWGSGGPISYQKEANAVLDALLKHCIGPRSRLPMLGDWVKPDGARHNQFTVRSSDFMPSHFRTWAKFSGNAVWNEVAQHCSELVSVMQEKHSPATGLLPDFIVGADPLSAAKPAGPRFLEKDQDGDYFFNAGRAPWRLGLDALLNGDPASRAQADKMATWAKSATQGDGGRIKAGYTLAGGDLPGSGYFSTFFASPLGVAAMMNADNQAFLDSIYAKVRDSHQGYYADTVNLLCLLAMSGNYWDPATIQSQAK
jgi:endo-1,4-beta-D-glucanase Y